MRSAYYRVRSFVAAAFRPPKEEVDAYARLIAQREGCSPEACREEAELQLWVWHAENAHSGNVHSENSTPALCP